jgi:hypothetical protein
MREINRIRATLVDPDLRAEYDQLLHIQNPIATPSAVGAESTLSEMGETRVAGSPRRSLLGRLPLGLLSGGILSFFWGPMLRSDPQLGRSTLSVVTGFLIGILTAAVRVSAAPVMCGAAIGLVVGAPYAFQNHLRSSLVAGGICGGLVVWVMGLLDGRDSR